GSALHPRARPDRRSARLREDVGATPLALRRAHRLELPGAGAQAVEAFPNLSAYEKKQHAIGHPIQSGGMSFPKERRPVPPHFPTGINTSPTPLPPPPPTTHKVPP